MAQVKERHLLAAFMAFMLALAGFMAFTVQSAWADDETIDVTFTLVGPGEDGNDVYYVDTTKVTMPAKSTAWDLTKKMFDENGIKYSASETEYGIYLESIVSPVTGDTLAYDATSGKFMHFFMDGTSSDTGASGVELKNGSSVLWNYSTYTSTLTATMYRLYNPNSGEHFYTQSDVERDGLVDVGWSSEGTGWYAPSISHVPVYRLYNSIAGDHHYTISEDERDGLLAVGWKYEGIGWYSDDNESVNVLRQYNPNAVTGSHNFTTSQEENDGLVSLGWQAEGVAWYGVAAEQ